MSTFVNEYALLVLALAVIGGTVLGAALRATRRSRQRRRYGRRYSILATPKHHKPIDTVAAAATLAQRLTGDSSGPYSGTPFPPDDDAIDAAGLSEGPSHERGIIDHSRHVSSIGRR